MFKKNTAGKIYFTMLDAATGAPTAGLTITGYRSLDGGAQAAVTGTFTSLGNGQYVFNAAAGDLNGNQVGLFFTATGMLAVSYTIITTGADVTDGVRLGLTSLPNAIPGASGGLPTTNGTKVNQTVDLTAGQTIAATIAAGAIATDAITAASVKVDAVTKIAAGIWNALTSGLTTAGSIGKKLADWIVGDLTSIDGQATNGNNATLNLKKLNIVNNLGDAIVAASTGANGRGILAAGHGTGAGLRTEGGSSGGVGIHALGASGGAGGDGLRAEGVSGANGLNVIGKGAAAINATSDASDGMRLNGGGNGNGLACNKAGSGLDINADQLDTLLTRVSGNVALDSTVAKEATLDIIKNKAGTTGYDRTTDSLEALRERVDQVMVSTGTAIGYAPTAAQRVIGEDEGGTFANLAALDDSNMRTGELALTGLEVIVTRNLSTTTENPSLLRVAGYYSGVASHSILVNIYNYALAVYENKGVMINRSTSFEYAFPLAPDNQDPVTGEMKVQFKHAVESYNVNHFLQLDFVSWEKVEGNSQIASDLASIKAKTDQTQFDDGFILARNEDGSKIAIDSTVAKETTLTSTYNKLEDLEEFTAMMNDTLTETASDVDNISVDTANMLVAIANMSATIDQYTPMDKVVLRDNLRLLMDKIDARKTSSIISE